MGAILESKEALREAFDRSIIIISRMFELVSNFTNICENDEEVSPTNDEENQDADQEDQDDDANDEEGPSNEDNKDPNENNEVEGSNDNNPPTFQDAINDPVWQEAIKEELDQVQAHALMEVIDPNEPANCNTNEENDVLHIYSDDDHQDSTSTQESVESEPSSQHRPVSWEEVNAMAAVALPINDHEALPITLNEMDSVNADFPLVLYEDTILDSGASGNMTHDINLLTDLYQHFSFVVLPDNSGVESNQRGTMRISVFDIIQQRRFTIPLWDTLHVPGLRAHLWSVMEFTACGHSVEFLFNTVKIHLNANLPNFETITLTLTHPYARKGTRPRPNAGLDPRPGHRDDDDDQSPVNYACNTEELDLKSPSMFSKPRPLPLHHVPMELMHHRMAHTNTKTLLVTREAKMWDDVKVNLTNDTFCSDCQIATIRSKNRGSAVVAQGYQTSSDPLP